MMLRAMRILFCLGLLLPLAVTAQAPESAPAADSLQKSEANAESTVTLRTNVNEVLLDVVVRNKSGKIIRDLKPGEVKVFENGAPQSVRHFEFLDGRATAAPPTPVAANAVTTTAGGRTAPLDVNALRDISVVSVVIANVDPRGRQLA